MFFLLISRIYHVFVGIYLSDAILLCLFLYRTGNCCFLLHPIYSNFRILLAHLSRRLTGELIGYPWIRRPSSSSVLPFTFSNIFSSETAWPIKAKFYVEPPWEGGTKVCINGPGHITKMAATPIYGKNLKKSSSPEPEGRFPRNLVCSIRGSSPS